MIERVEVAVVGGGLAGSAIAAILARAGHDILVLERQPSWRWRACGVFSSPAAMTELRRLGLDETILSRVARPIPAMRVETPAGTSFRLTYGDEGSGTTTPVGFDRSALDPSLSRLAAEAGARIRAGVAARSVEIADRPGARFPASIRASDGSLIEARMVIGADGIRSVVARSLGVARRSRLSPRIGLTYHLGADDEPRGDARMVVFPGGYCGIAPVPGGRVNVGIVLGGGGWRRTLARAGAQATSARVVGSVPRGRERETWRQGPQCEAVAGAWPLGHRVARRAGDGWLLVGDAAGFLDPFTGEGIHRALVSARIAAAAVDAHLAGHHGALPAYERHMRSAFAGKDVLSWIVQLFLSRPVLLEYAARRIAARPRQRETMGLVMGDLIGARHALDPRYLAALLAP